MAIIKAVITTLDNLPLLKEQVNILKTDPLISEIIVVSNGSRDGTNEWLATQNVTSVIRENRGAGPGRNSGLDAAGKFDYVLMLDGGIRPLVGGTAKMLEYLERHPANANRFTRVDVIGTEIPHLETDIEKAWRRWPGHLNIKDPKSGHSKDTCHAYHNWRLSQTAYCLARWEAFDGIRFCEEGPFGEAGWGADDDEMMCQWRNKDIIVHAVCNVHPYRRASGSFRRLFQETGIWPNQYGSVYESRVVWLQQNWPQYSQGIQWGEPWLTVVVKVGESDETIKTLKLAHDLLRQRQFEPPWDKDFNPYSIIAWCPEADTEFLEWAEPRRLRQHHGGTLVVNEKIFKRGPINEEFWVGDFRVWTDKNWQAAIRTNAYYYILVNNQQELKKAMVMYNNLHPQQASDEIKPSGKGRININ